MSLAKWFSLEGTVAVVTGAGSGLGRAMAEGVAGAGARVVCVDVDAAGLGETVARIGEAAHGVVADVSVESDVQRIMQEAVDRFGSVDALFNNAGVNGPTDPLHEVGTEDWNRTVAVNLTGVYLCSREALKLMVPKGRGKIINTASVWGLVGSSLRPLGPYTATKGAVVNLTHELAVEYAPHGITVNAVAPLGFATNIAGGITFKNPEVKAKLTSKIPMGRIAQPEEIQGLAIFLASPSSDYLTGAVIPIDGGFTSW